MSVPSDPGPDAVPPPHPRLLLIGWDAADWQVIHPLLDAGQMPNLRRLVDGGMMGNLQSLQPMLSPILWTSIATGRRADAHGVRGFVEPLPDRSGVRPVGTRSRRCKALWNILSQAGFRSVVCGWMASHPAEPLPRGAVVSNAFAVPPAGAAPGHWPVAADSVQPPGLAESLAELRVHPREVEGGMVLPFIPRAAELDQTDPAVQRRLHVLVERLAETIGVHASATELLETTPWDFAAVYYECIDAVGHEFMPFHAPALPGIPPGEAAVHGEVVNAVYRYHDAMLGRLIELAGPGARVMIVSDHGFESGPRRPRGVVDPARWHRAQGVFVAHGPGIRADGTVEGGTLLDIAPTVLTAFGLPVGEDMAGKPLVQIFSEPLAVTRIPSWEEVPGEDGRLPPAAAGGAGGEEDPAAAQAVLAQFIALGYLEAPGEDVLRAVARAEAEADFNLAAALLEGGRATEAKELLAALAVRHPDERRYWHALAAACFAAGTAGEAAPCLAALERLEPGAPATLVLRGVLAWAREDFTASAVAFAAAEERAPDDPMTLTYLGRLSLRQRRWAEAERQFQRALALDPDLAEAHYGLSVALPRQDRVEAGIDHALRAVGLRHDFPEAHFQLGATLSRLGWFERAAQAFEMTLRQRPGFVLAHRYLARIYARLGRTALAQRHREESGRLLETRVPQPVAD